MIVNGIIRLYSFDCFRIDTGVKLAPNIPAITVLCYLQVERDVGEPTGSNSQGLIRMTVVPTTLTMRLNGGAIGWQKERPRCRMRIVDGPGRT